MRAPGLVTRQEQNQKRSSGRRPGTHDMFNSLLIRFTATVWSLPQVYARTRVWQDEVRHAGAGRLGNHFPFANLICILWKIPKGAFVFRAVPWWAPRLDRLDRKTRSGPRPLLCSRCAEP